MSWLMSSVLGMVVEVMGYPFGEPVLELFSYPLNRSYAEGWSLHWPVPRGPGSTELSADGSLTMSA